MRYFVDTRSYNTLSYTLFSMFIGRKVKVNAIENSPINASSKCMASNVNGRLMEKLFIKSFGIVNSGRFLCFFIIFFIVPFWGEGRGDLRSCR